MATVDKTVGQVVADRTAGARSEFMITNTIDCALFNQAQNDVSQMLSIAAGWLVRNVCIKVVTAEGATLTMNVGDGADVDGFLAGTNGNATGMSLSALALTEGTPNTITGYMGGKFYSAADTIDIVWLNAATKAKVTITALVFDFN